MTTLDASPASESAAQHTSAACGGAAHGGSNGRGNHGVHVRNIFTPELLDQCIACGFCLPVCPTYQMTGVEQFSPRGRISLMRALQAGQLDPDDPTLLAQSSACLGCRRCETVCPAGVRYGDLLEEWRDHQWRGRHRPPLVRGLMLMVRWTWPLRLLGLVRRAAPAGRTNTPAEQSSAPTGGSVTPTTSVGAAVLPAVAPTGMAAVEPAAARSSTPETPDVGPSLMLGCVERALFPSVSRAATKLCPELSVPGKQGCCGALHSHNGEKKAGERMAAELGEQLPGTIVTTAGGCAAHLAAVVGEDRVKELSQYLVEKAAPFGGQVWVDGRRARVTLQDSCHLRNALGVVAQPREVLAAVADYVELPEAATCCGAAGSYSLLQPRRSRVILAEKVAAIERLDVDIVVTLNPGCQRQLVDGLRRAKSKVRAVHIADLLTQTRSGPDSP